MYKNLTDNEDTGDNEYFDLTQTPPYSHEDFNANLIPDSVEKDFKYFNKASNLFKGYQTRRL